MIKYSITNRKIEITYATGLEYVLIKQLLKVIDIFNETSEAKK